MDSDLRQRLQQLSAAENPATKPQAPPLPAAKSPTDREATNRSARSVVGVATNGTPRNAIVQTSFQQEETQTAPPEIKQTSAEERKQPAFLDLDSTDETHASAEASEPSDMDMILRLVTWTVIILCLCVLTVLGLRRWQRKNGMLPIVLPQEQVDLLMSDSERGENARMTVDLEAQEITTSDGDVIKFDVDPFRKHCLLNGLDDIGLTLEKADSIQSFEAKAAQERPWV